MAVSLKKGDSAVIHNTLRMAVVGLGWDPNPSLNKKDFDLDLSAFLCTANGRVWRDNDFIYYNNLRRDNIVIHSPDDKKGTRSDGGDDEWMCINFTQMPDYVQKIAIIVTIHEAEIRRQNFGQISNSFVRFAKMRNGADTVGETLWRFDLKDEFPTDTAMLVGEICRKNGSWEFNAIADGYRCDLSDFCRLYGVSLKE